MMKIVQLKTLLVAAFMSSSLLGVGQSKNVFLERSFWGGSPTVTDVEAKIAEGFDPTARTGNGFDGVTYAILQNAPTETIAFMLSFDGNDVNKITHDGRNYIFWAAMKENLPVMEILVNKGSRIDIVDSHKNSPLTFAATNGVKDTMVYNFLIAQGLDVDFTEEHGATALLLAAPFDSDFVLMDYFMEKGSDLYALDDEGNSAFNYAARTGNTEMMDLLIEKEVVYKTLNNDGGNAMFFAARGTRNKTNPLSVYAYLESKGVEPNVTTNSGTTPLHILARRNDDMEVLQFFLNSGVDLNQIDKEGSNALMIASSGNKYQVVQLFAKATTNINAENVEGETALNNALSGNSPEVVRYLVSQGAKPNAQSGEALISSVNGDDTNDFQIKLRALKMVGFEPTKPGEGGNTLLHYAAANNNVSLMKLLSQEGIDINAVNDDGYTALMIAAMKSSNAQVMEFLVAQGANTKLKTEFGETAYDLAAENELLAENNVNINFLK